MSVSITLWAQSKRRRNDEQYMLVINFDIVLKKNSSLHGSYKLGPIRSQKKLTTYKKLVLQMAVTN